MAPFARPVRGEEVAASAELALRYPSSHRSRLGSTADEGEGTGWDNAYPYAYADQWFDTADDPTAVEEWFREALGALGWREAGAHYRDESRMVTWIRDHDEEVSLTWFSKSLDLGWDHLSHRLAYRVDGSWPDGGNDARPR